MSGMDRYYQIVRCFRDEDLRADRQPEFTQIDIETSFIDEEEIMSMTEYMVRGIFSQVLNVELPNPFPRMSYDEAIRRFGSDKPDLRNPLEICDLTEVFARDDVEFNAFKGVISKGGVVRAIRAPKVSELPRSFFDKLNSWAQGEGAPGLGYILFADGKGKGPIAKFVPAAAQDQIKEISGCEDGDAIFFICNQELPAAKFAGAARDAICSAMDEAGIKTRETGVYKFCWIVCN